MNKSNILKWAMASIALIGPLAAFPQKTSRDLLVLRDGNTQAGKVITSDSLTLTLRKYDHSTQKYLWADIDSVKGLALKTFFFSGALGLSHANYWSTLLYKNQQSTSAAFNYKLGILKWGHWSRYAELILMPSKPFKIQRLGIGGSYYIPYDYTRKTNYYGGADINLTIVSYNKNYISTGLHFGTEYLYKNRYRLFAELDLQRAIFNMNKNTSFCFMVGIRSGKEFAKYYRNLNSTHQVK
ncbi:MAG: hypothetical protein SGJ10_10575 [Bacteroidota bacterium]|nr:hypothetical protein [Bacteroidota bacterium]